MPPAPPPGSPVGTWNRGQSGGRADEPVPGETLRQRFRGVAKLANTAPKRLLLVFAVASLIAIGAFLANQNSTTKVQGNMIMMNSGWKGTIDCNNGTLKLDGDSRQHTVTGHCLRLRLSVAQIKSPSTAPTPSALSAMTTRWPTTPAHRQSTRLAPTISCLSAPVDRRGPTGCSNASKSRRRSADRERQL